MNETRNENLPDQLAQRGTQVYMALIERGVKDRLASDAATAYINTLSLMCVNARKFGATFGKPSPEVIIEPMSSGDLQTIVRGGKWEYGKIWLDVDSDPLKFVFATQEGHGEFTAAEET